jgi:N-acetylneuraminate lyase
MSLQGFIAAPHTPFQVDGRLWLEQVAAQAQHLARTGVSGAFVGGTTGEATSMTTAERCQLFEAWCEAAADLPLQVVAHVGHNCQQDAITMAQHAAKLGVDAISAFAPSYFRPASLDDLIQFLQPITQSAEACPFYFYDIPSMTGVQFSMLELLQRAAEELPTLAGLKATTADLMGLQECLDYGRDRFNILFGMDEILLSVLPLGVQGAVGSTYNFAAPLYLELVAAFEAQDFEKARSLQLKSVQFVRCLASYGFMPAAKSAMSMIGVDCGICRPPAKNLTESQKQSLRSDLEKLGFFDWQSR